MVPTRHQHGRPTRGQHVIPKRTEHGNRQHVPNTPAAFWKPSELLLLPARPAHDGATGLSLRPRGAALPVTPESRYFFQAMLASEPEVLRKWEAGMASLDRPVLQSHHASLDTLPTEVFAHLLPPHIGLTRALAGAVAIVLKKRGVLAGRSLSAGGKTPYAPGSASGGGSSRKDGWEVFAVKEHAVPGAAEAPPPLGVSAKRVSTMQTADGAHDAGIHARTLSTDTPGSGAVI